MDLLARVDRAAPPTLDRLELAGVARGLTLQPGDSLTVKLVGRQSDGSRVDVTAGAEWTSSDESVLYANDGKSKGFLHAGAKGGTATLKAAYGGQTLVVPVTVAAPATK